ncbi:MAG TPA: penicillin-binding protein 1C [Stellaceae bacterium]|nr:penicillin-binding protein 1C [Stellaceae bacterium]
MATAGARPPPQAGEGRGGGRHWRWPGGLALAVACLIAGYFVLPPPKLDRSERLSTLVLARDGSILRGFLSSDSKWRLPTAVSDVDPLYRRMLIAAEDRRFDEHWGVDPLAVIRAAGQWAMHGHVVSGASTLTMQAVRLLERRPRTLASKIVESAEAVELDRRLGKDAILDIYLTLAPFGGNLEGVRAASLAYFGKEPAHLTAAEAALLVAIPRSPEQFRPDRQPAAARQARDAVLRRMATVGVISAQEFADASVEVVPQTRTALPFHALHLAKSLHRGEPHATILRTTIDPRLQREVEALLRREATALDPQSTFAALVIDNRERRVLAYVGNADYLSGQRHGTIDMARAIRSPGSALKPFIYAMAFDRLIIHPETILDDEPRHFGDYSPGDFDGRFLGEVTAREALQYSLNVPAVAVLDRLRPARFVSALAAAGIRLKLPHPSSEPGLAVALGGDGISLLDLATLYVALSHDGAVAPLQTELGAPEGKETTIFGPVAAWYVNDILAGAPPPPGMLPAELRRTRKLAFKTGTSYGFRDAWAVGYDPEVTIAVWAGRPDGTPMAGITGRTTAAPVVFKIADLLGLAGAPAWPKPPPGALLVARRNLPASLQRLDPGPAERAGRDHGGPKIVYPPDGSIVEWHGESVPLDAAGGSAPLRWLADGKPLPQASPRHELFWHPDSVGFTQLTVIDAAGRSAHATVRLEP